VVGTLFSFPAELTVPGGARLQTSAVTGVTTTATHRRRGLATRMVAGELAATARRGELAGILIAAEWLIYGRFGYGAATEHQTWTLDARAGRLREVPPGTVEFVDRDTARALAPELFDRHRAARPGEISRTERYWDINFGILRYPSWPEPKPGLHAVARDRNGAVAGIARYEYEDRWQGRLPGGEAVVRMFLADGPVGEALLWHHLLSLDLVTTVKVADRPVDDPLPWLLADARHAQAGDRADFLWIRPLDVAGMLAARTYLTAGRLVLEVLDEAGLAGGRYALDGGPDGAHCERTGAPPDLTLDVATLGSAYLGGYPLRTLAAAGLVGEHTAGALRAANLMFGSATTPWCSTWF
jgi:predicted acetyltransferase